MENKTLIRNDTRAEILFIYIRVAIQEVCSGFHPYSGHINCSGLGGLEPIPDSIGHRREAGFEPPMLEVRGNSAVPPVSLQPNIRLWHDRYIMR